MEQESLPARNWPQVMEEYKSSRLSRVEFCREKGIAPSTFQSQLTRFRQESRPKKRSYKKKSSLFLPILHRQSEEITIKVSGIELHFDRVPSAEWMRDFIQGWNHV